MPKRKTRSQREAKISVLQDDVTEIQHFESKLLPHDILCLIFDQAAGTPKPLDYPSQLEGEHWIRLQREIDDEWRESSSVLAKLSLVSKEWNSTAIPLLYRYILVRKDYQALRAGKTIEMRHKNPSHWIGASHGSFVRIIDVDIRQTSSKLDTILIIHRLVSNSPHLHSFRTSIWGHVSRRSDNMITGNATRVVPYLLENGNYLTTLDISDSTFQVPDLQRLISGLATLETFIANTNLMMELQTKQSKTTSLTLKTIVIIEPDQVADAFYCRYDLTFAIIATWILPRFQSLIVHDDCPVQQVLANMKPLLWQHKGNLREVVFRRWSKVFSEDEKLLLGGTFPEFEIIRFIETSRYREAKLRNGFDLLSQTLFEDFGRDPSAFLLRVLEFTSVLHYETVELNKPTIPQSVRQNAAVIQQFGSKLPHDILCLIFDQAAGAPKPLDYLAQIEGEHWTIIQQEVSNAWRGSSNVLANLSLVSKDWNTTAIPFLYRYMRLRTEGQVWTAGISLEYRHKNPSPWVGAPHGSFVRVLDVGNRREIGDFVDIADIITSVSKLVSHSPHLQLFRTSAWDSVSKKSNHITTRYTTRILPGLLKNGSHITTLEISDSRFQVPDLQRLINDLPLLETFIVSTMLMMELETKQRKTTSTSLKTIVIIEPEGTKGDALCLYDTVFNIVSTWILPNLHSLLVHDRCRVSQVLANMKPLLSRHQAALQTIVFRRWAVKFSEQEVCTMQSALSQFKTTSFTETSVRFSKE